LIKNSSKGLSNVKKKKNKGFASISKYFRKSMIFSVFLNMKWINEAPSIEKNI
jgi:hypothetical protein